MASMGFLPQTAVVRAAFERTAATFDENAILHMRAAEELDERLDVMRLTPALVLDLGAGTGALGPVVRARFPQAAIIHADLSHSMLARIPGAAQGSLRRLLTPLVPRRRGSAFSSAVQCDARALPLADMSVDLVLSNLAMHWCDPRAVMAEIHRVLKPEGALLFSCFGPDTLRELDAAWHTAGAGERTGRFMDMHDLGDVMLDAGLLDPVVDMDQVTLTYGAPADLWRDLRAMGSRNVRGDRPRFLTGKRRFRAMEQALLDSRDAEGRFAVTAELIYGNAWARPVQGRGQPTGPDGGLRVPFTRSTPSP